MEAFLAEFWRMDGDLGWGWRIVFMLAVVLGGALIFWIAGLIIRRSVNGIVHGAKKRLGAANTEVLEASPLYQVRVVQRTKAIGGILRTVVAWIVAVVAIIIILQIAGLSSTWLVASAGLFGAAAGVGAQNVIKDFLNGLFMVFEDQLGVGDVVDLGSATGVVESIGIRVTQIRDVNGTLWYVRNGEIVRVGNMSQGWARVILDLGVPYDVDVEAVQQSIIATAHELAAEPKWRARMLEQPELWGIESISEAAVIIRLVVKTRSTSKDDVARELRTRLLRKFEEQGIALPSLQSVVLEGFEGAGSVRGARPPKTSELPLSDPKQ